MAAVVPVVAAPVAAAATLPVLPVFGVVSGMLMGGAIAGIVSLFTHHGDRRDLPNPGADAALTQALLYFDNVTKIEEAALLRGMVVEPALDDLVAKGLIPPPPEGKGKRERQLVAPLFIPFPAGESEGEGDHVDVLKNRTFDAVFSNPEKNFSVMGLISGLLNEPVNGIRHGRLALNLGPEHANKTAEGKWLLAHPSEASKNQTDGFASMRETLEAWNDLAPEAQRIITEMIVRAHHVEAINNVAAKVAMDVVAKNVTADTAVKVVMDVANEVLERTKEMKEADADPTLLVGPLGPIGYRPIDPVDRINDLVNQMKSEETPAPSQ